jgi:hypothetical protein
MTLHSSYPQPGCPTCEALAQRGGYTGVTEYLQQKERTEATALTLPDREKAAA